MIIAFSDLDDTLFSSPRKYDSLEETTPATTTSSGEVGAYASHAQSKMLEMLAENCLLVPVTGRPTASLNRVSFKFKGDKVSSHGAIILDSENNILAEWKQVLDAEVGPWSLKMTQLNTVVCAYIEEQKLNLRVRIVEDYGYPCYLCIKGDAEDLVNIQAADFGQLSDGFFIHINSRNLAFLPPYANKQRAVLFLKERYQKEFSGNKMYLGLGDSSSDLHFMSECDFQVFPSASQIAETMK